MQASRSRSDLDAQAARSGARPTLRSLGNLWMHRLIGCAGSLDPTAARGCLSGALAFPHPTCVDGMQIELSGPLARSRAPPRLATQRVDSSGFEPEASRLQSGLSTS